MANPTPTSTAKKSSTAKKPKLNRKVVMLVGGFVLFALVVLGGVAYFTIAGAPERNIRLGDEALKAAEAAELAGDADEAYKRFQDALSRYGRAVSKRPNNLDYNLKMVDTLLRVTPKTSSDATELYGRLDRLLRKRTQSAPLDAAQWMKYLNSAEARANLFEDPGLWKDMVDICDEALEKLPDGAPGREQVESARIRAQLAQDKVLTVEERVAAEQAARVFLAEHPGDAPMWASLLRSIHSDATRLALANRGSESLERTKAFESDLIKARAGAPNDAAIQVAELARLISRAFAGDPLVTPSAVDEVVAPLLWKGGDHASTEFGSIATAPAPSLLELARLVSASSNTEYPPQMIRILESFCASHPEELLAYGALAQAQRDAGRRDDARASFERMIAVPRLKVSMLSAFQDDIRVTAAEKLFDIDFLTWEAATNPADKQSAVEAMRKSRARLAELAAGREGEISIIRADAKLAFAEADFLTAVAKLEEVFARAGTPTSELFLLSAISLIERGELGAALVKIDRGLSEYPAMPQLHLTRARVLSQLGRITDARRSVATVLARFPGLPEAESMQAELAKHPGEGTVNLGDMVVKVLGDAELLAREGKVEEATVMLETALVTYPKDVRLQRTIVQWLMFVGDMPTARTRLTEYLADHSDDEVLKQLEVLADKESPMDRAIAFVDLRSPTPQQRAAEVLVALINLRDDLTNRLSSADPARTAVINSELAKIAAAFPDAKAKAVELAPGESVVLDRLLTEALRTKDAAGADQVIALAEKSAIDRSIPALLRGRVAMERSDFAKAIEQFEIAQALPGAGAAGFRLLGVAKERSGDIAGARDAYRTAYERRPNDIASVQLYAGLLARSGNMPAAREVLQAAMLAMPESAELRNIFLEVEGQFGSRADSMIERRRLYAVRPSDVDNARQLLRILIETPPTREFIINSDGSQKYSAADWESLGSDRREQELDALSQTQQAEAQTVFDRLLRMNEDTRPSIRIYAAAMQRAGRGIEAERTLRALAEKETGPLAWRGWFDVGELLAEDGRPEDGKVCFAKAIELDRSGQGDAARAVAAYWIDNRRPLFARAVLEPQFLATPTLDLARRLASVQLEVRDFAAAKKTAAEVARLAGPATTFSDQLLSADIANAELESSFGAMDPGEVKAAQAAFDRAIDAAIRADPSSPVPYIVRAGSLQRRFQRAGEADILTQAKRDIDRAYELQANFWPATRLRASIYMDEGDMLSAIQVVRRYVEQTPRNVDARRALVGYFIASGDFRGAIDAVNTAMASEPNNPVWIDALAEAYIAAGQLKEAGDAYEKLYQSSGDMGMLTKSILMRIRAVPSDYAGILAALRTAKGDTSTVPFLTMAGAAAIAGAGENDVQRNQGVIQLREMYKRVASEPTMVDGWIIAAGSLYPADKVADLEKFISMAADGVMTSALERNIANRWVEAGPGGPAKGVEHAIKSVALATNDDEKFLGLMMLGNAAYAAGDRAAAADAFAKCLAIHADSTAAINNLAFIEAMDPSKVTSAIERSRIALAHEPANVDLMDTLGYALTKANQLPEALSHLQRAARMRATAPTYAHLAMVQALLGRRSEAEESIRRARALRPDAEASREIDEAEKKLTESQGTRG